MKRSEPGWDPAAVSSETGHSMASQPRPSRRGWLQAVRMNMESLSQTDTPQPLLLWEMADMSEIATLREHLATTRKTTTFMF